MAVTSAGVTKVDAVAITLFGDLAAKATRPDNVDPTTTAMTPGRFNAPPAKR
jgi:hypothetical protein